MRSNKLQNHLSIACDKQYMTCNNQLEHMTNY